MKVNFTKICILIIAVVIATFLSTCKGTIKTARPNIVIIMADDMGYFDIGCYGSDIQTPNIDRLAEEGILLTDFYSAAPNCSPARAGLLTGRTPSRTGVYDWVPDNSPMHLPESEITLAEILQDNGYSTCHVGKWHLAQWTKEGGIESPNPGEQGFDYWFAVDNNALPTHLNPVNFKRNGEPVGKLQGYSCQLIIDEGIKWLQDRKDKKQPFFLNVWFNEQHKKLASPPELIEKHADLSPDEALYYANIENLDRAVGKLLQSLDQMDLGENTMILFTSDNGPWRTESAGHFRGKKSDLYEGGIREPGIIRWPNQIMPESKSNVPAGFVDMLPTICEIIGSELPDDRHIDGTSILPLLRGEDIHRKQSLFWFFYKSSPTAVIRKGDYVLTADPAELYRSKSHKFDQTDLDYLKSLEFERFQLFNVSTDPGQGTDISREHPEMFEELKSELLHLYKQMIKEGPVWDDLPSDKK